MQDTEMEHERRIATLEGVAVETRETLRSIDNRLNILDQRLTYMGVQHRNHRSCLCRIIRGNLPAGLEMELADELLQVVNPHFQGLRGNP